MLKTMTIVLAENEQHVSLCCDREPDASETSVDSLAKPDFGGWLCELEGDYYGMAAPSLMPLRILGQPATQFGKATRFLNLRRDYLSS